MTESDPTPQGPSRFKLAIPAVEGLHGEAHLRHLFFEAIEESLDCGAELDHAARPAFEHQLVYAEVLAGIGEDARAVAQLELALESAETGTAHINEIFDVASESQLLRHQAVALAAVAAKFHRTGNPDTARYIMKESGEKLARALDAEDAPGPEISEMHRGIRETISVLDIAGSLADTGNVEESEALRVEAPLDVYSYGLHLDVLDRQAAALPEWDEETRQDISGRKWALFVAVREEMRNDLRDEGQRLLVKIEEIEKLHKIAESHGVTINLAGLLEDYEEVLVQPPDVTPEQPPGESVTNFELPSTKDVIENYRNLLGAYVTIGRPEKALTLYGKLGSYMDERIAAGDDEAREDLVRTQIELGLDIEADKAIGRIELRHRLELRYLQARFALDVKKDASQATAILNTGMAELVRRYEEEDPEEDEHETGMGLKFVQMYGDMGQYDFMDKAYAILEAHNGRAGGWETLRGENRSAHPPIARRFMDSGKVKRAFDAIRYASDVEQAGLLTEVMKKVCAPEPRPIEAMFIDQEELAEALRRFTEYRQDTRYYQD